jgi:hypothetical protein
MESAMDYPVIRKFLESFFRLVPGARSASFIDGASDPTMSAVTTASREDPPFVLVAHGAGGQWEVYAKDFEHPLASFNERQAGCDFASNLAKTRENAIVLIRESQGLRG